MILKLEAHFHNGQCNITVDVPSHDPLYWRRAKPWAQTTFQTEAPKDAAAALRQAVLHLCGALQLVHELERALGDANGQR
jgi:hypothetical protein